MAALSGFVSHLGKGLLVAGAIAAGSVIAHLAPERAGAAVPRSTPSPAFVEAAPAEPSAIAGPSPAAPDAPRMRDPLGSDMARGLIIGGATPHRILLFTFDDGPERRTTPRLLDMLDREGIKAVFFLTTNRILDATPRNRQQAEIAREILRRGHAIGAHSVNHVQLPTLDDVGVAYEIDEAARLIEREVGARPFLVRPPGGSRSPRVDGLIAQRGYTQVLWNLGAGDFQVSTPDLVYETFFKVLERKEREEGQRGGIVLLHDTYEHTVEAFPRIVAELRRRNCELLARGEELYDFGGDVAMFHVPRGEEDGPSAEAPPMVLPPEVLATRQARLREENRSRCAAPAEPR
ncbi:MAG: polysaccharide deacetylase family protein [Polyangiales bacterium]